MVESFGRRSVDPEPEAPQFPLPQITVMLSAVLDGDTLEEACARIRERVAEAVRGGFTDALSEVMGAADAAVADEVAARGGEQPPAAQFDTNPTVDSQDPLAYERYAKRLDREAPDWWKDVDPDSMAPGLADEAHLRRFRAEDAAKVAAAGRTQR